MTPTVAMALGFVVAALILLWAVVILIQRYNRHRKASKRSIWVTLKPMSTAVHVKDISREVLPEQHIDDNETNDHFKQNGHYSHPK